MNDFDLQTEKTLADSKFTLSMEYKKSPIAIAVGLSCDPVGIRTPNLRIRSAMLYPVELQSHFPDETGGKDTNSC